MLSGQTLKTSKSLQPDSDKPAQVLPHARNLSPQDLRELQAGLCQPQSNPALGPIPRPASCCFRATSCQTVIVRPRFPDLHPGKTGVSCLSLALTGWAAGLPGGCRSTALCQLQCTFKKLKCRLNGGVCRAPGLGRPSACLGKEICSLSCGHCCLSR